MINDNYNEYQQRIQFLRCYGDVLLQRIKALEINMNKRKQQNQQPMERDVNSLNAMVKKLLQMLAEINACQYFQLTNEQFDLSDNYFNQMCNRYFEDLIQKFVAALRIRRIQRLQNLQHIQHLQYLQRFNNIIHPVDFKIEQM